MNDSERKSYVEFINDVNSGKVHGLEIGCSDAGEMLAFQYLMRGYGEFIPDEIDRVMLPNVEKIVVKKFGDEPHSSEEYGLEWGVDVVFCSFAGVYEHFEFWIACKGHGGTVI